MTSFPIAKTAGVFWINREDWARYVNLCVDGAKLPTTYSEWVSGAERVTQNLAREGWEVIKVDVDLAEFAAWCKANALDIDKVARIRYANEIAAARIEARGQPGRGA